MATPHMSLDESSGPLAKRCDLRNMAKTRAAADHDTPLMNLCFPPHDAATHVQIQMQEIRQTYFQRPNCVQIAIKADRTSAYGFNPRANNRLPVEFQLTFGSNGGSNDEVVAMALLYIGRQHPGSTSAHDFNERQQLEYLETAHGVQDFYDQGTNFDVFRYQMRSAWRRLRNLAARDFLLEDIVVHPAVDFKHYSDLILRWATGTADDAQTRLWTPLIVPPNVEWAELPEFDAVAVHGFKGRAEDVLCVPPERNPLVLIVLLRYIPEVERQQHESQQVQDSRSEAGEVPEDLQRRVYEWQTGMTS